MRAIVLGTAALGFLAVAACGSDGGSGDPPDAPPSAERTYYQDVKPIVDAKCTMCHVAGGIAPFPLDSFAEIVDRASVVKEEIAAGTMPPWPPNDDCNDYVGNRSIDDAQRQTIIDWVDQGAKPGDPANPGAPLDVEQIALSRVDRTLEMPVDYTTTATALAPDDYRCFVLPWQETGTKYVTGFRATPGDARIVHHVVAFLAEPGQVATYNALDAAEAGVGYTCFGGSGGPSMTLVGTWVPGQLGSDFPAGTGLRINEGSAIILQVHYNVTTTQPGPDRTSLEFKLDDTVTKVARTLPFANPTWLSNPASMLIPAGASDHVHQFQINPSLFLGYSTFDIYAAGLHMHQLGTRAKLELVPGDGSPNKCVLQIDDWNFHWQGSYGLRQPMRFSPGDQLRIECHWDNSPEHQPIVNGQQQPPRDVTWGEGTSDEMCLGGFYVAPP
jgi:hypothetical protein